MITGRRCRTICDVRARSGDLARFSQNGGLPVVSLRLAGSSAAQLHEDMEAVRSIIRVHVHAQARAVPPDPAVYWEQH